MKNAFTENCLKGNMISPGSYRKKEDFKERIWSTYSRVLVDVGEYVNDYSKHLAGPGKFSFEIVFPCVY